MNYKQNELHQPPTAQALSESLRSLGYSTETALADLIDNSITANAKNVWLSIARAGQNAVDRLALLDDGNGMDRVELLAAMRPGTRDPRAVRLENDLGRFGLGLKTASFSQCRTLTVASKKAGGDVNVLRWDLDHVAATNTWQLLQGPPPDVLDDLELLRKKKSGTLVIWTGIDALDVGDVELIRRVREHLALTFHRFIEIGELKIFISMDARLLSSLPVPKVDPFMRANPAMATGPAEVLNDLCAVQIFVLPHPDRCTDEERLGAALGRDWRDRQGIYVYRNNRLLVAGGWLGLKRGWKNDADTQLARISVDFLNTQDQDWKIDVLKSRASPPPQVRHRLMRLAEVARSRSTKLFLHRATTGRRQGPGKSPDALNVPLWTSQAGPLGRVFAINAEHPAIRRVLQESPAAPGALGLLARSLPMAEIWHEYRRRIGDDEHPVAEPDDRPTRLSDLLEFMRYETRKGGRTIEDVVRDVRTMVPFCDDPDLIDEALLALKP